MSTSFSVPIVALLVAVAVQAATYETAVKPILTQTCSGCHNDKLTSGGLNVALYLDPATVETKREAWEAILAKLRSGEMPPKGIPKPPADQMSALMIMFRASLTHRIRR